MKIFLAAISGAVAGNMSGATKYLRAEVPQLAKYHHSAHWLAVKTCNRLLSTVVESRQPGFAD
jgi:hypothetical protein